MAYITADGLCCQVRVYHRVLAEKLLYSYALSAASIKNTLSQAVQEYGIVGVIKTDKWVLNLGTIPAAQFDAQFNQRLAQVFAERLAYEQTSASDPPEVSKLEPRDTESEGGLNATQPGAVELYQLALCCLQPSALSQLLQDKPAGELQQLLKLLLTQAGQYPQILPASYYSRVTASRLSIAAVLYLLNSRQGVDWMSHHSPATSQLSRWAKAIASGEIPPNQVVQLLVGNHLINPMPAAQPARSPMLIMRWVLPLWQQKMVRDVIRRQEGASSEQQIDAYLSRGVQRWDNPAMREDKGMHTGVALPRDNSRLSEGKGINATSPRLVPQRWDHPRLQDEPVSPGHGISNAGLLLLWPILPQLFTQLELCDEQQFISDAARWQAVHCLERLVWGEANPTEERLTLNQVLCGFALLTPAPPPAPLSALQQQKIDDWLTAIGQQLPGWQKLNLTDIRQLFLQRPGEIIMETPLRQIRVKPEPYDFLLRDWEWPMALASFPWLERPLTVIWPLQNGLTG